MHEVTPDYLAARQYAYAVFQRLLGEEPTAELLGAVDVDVLGDALQIVCGEASGDALCELRAQLTGAAGRAESLAAEYTRLFVGPAALPALPWESVYTTHRRLVMQRSTLDVRGCYRAQGFIPALYPHVPDDHVALELDFLATLATAALEAQAAGDEAACREKLEASRAFAHDHLGAWVDQYAAELAEKGGSAFYGAVARAAAALVACDAAVLGEVLAP